MYLTIFVFFSVKLHGKANEQETNYTGDCASLGYK